MRIDTWTHQRFNRDSLATDHPDQITEWLGKRYKLSYTENEVWATLVD